MYNPDKLKFNILRNLQRIINGTSFEANKKIFISDDFINMMFHFLSCNGNEKIQFKVINIVYELFEVDRKLIRQYLAKDFARQFVNFLMKNSIYDMMFAHTFYVVFITKAIITDQPQLMETFETIIHSSLSKIESNDFLTVQFFDNFFIAHPPINFFKKLLPVISFVLSRESNFVKCSALNWLQNLPNDFKYAKAIEHSDCWNDLRMIKLRCGDEDMRKQASKIRRNIQYNYNLHAIMKRLKI